MLRRVRQAAARHECPWILAGRIGLLGCSGLGAPTDTPVVTDPIRGMRIHRQAQARAVTACATCPLRQSNSRAITRLDGLTVSQGAKIDPECLLDKRRGGWLSIK